MVEQQIKFFPQRGYPAVGQGELDRMKQAVASLPAAQKPKPVAIGSSGTAPPPPVTAGPAPRIHVSGSMRGYQSAAFQISYPQEWQQFDDRQTGAVTFAPKAAAFQIQGGNAYGYGVQASLFQTQNGKADLRRDTDRLIQQLQGAGLKRSNDPPRNLQVDGSDALLTLLSSQSPYQGETEMDVLLTVARPQGLFFVVFFTPKSQYQNIEPAFEQITQSIKFR
jgi:hypothetical protein